DATTRQALYSVLIPVGGAKGQITASDLGSDTDLYVYGPDAMTIIAKAVNSGTVDRTLGTSDDPLVLPPGRIYLLLWSQLSTDSEEGLSFHLTFDIKPNNVIVNPTQSARLLDSQWEVRSAIEAGRTYQAPTD